MKKRVPTQFGALLDSLARKSRLGSRSAVGAEVGIPDGFMSDIYVGRRTPPLDKLPAMAEALGLSGPERDSFIRAGQLAHAPQEVRDYQDAQAQQVRSLRLRMTMAFRKREPRALAEKIGVDPIEIALLLSKPTRDQDLLEALCAELGIEVSFVMDGTPVPEEYRAYFEDALAIPAVEYQAKEQARIKAERRPGRDDA